MVAMVTVVMVAMVTVAIVKYQSHCCTSGLLSVIATQFI